MSALEPGDFERQASQPSAGLLREVLSYLRQSGKWWLTPVVLALLVIGMLIVIGETAIAPFIYALF